VWKKSCVVTCSQHLISFFFSQVDRGINPETYTELIINSAVERTARTRGRVLALEVFRDAIGAEMQRTMPDLWNQFQEQRSK
jgi:hypothetical protein